ncbi:MAG: tRNA (adenosine(37)-N6)-threonylcarbamoyltransferase complex ATPase subunit type 1 TsaE [Caldithrix sp.]|nr:tRNA (adenosine(37)-N6)-threonylcarbamoyltransferase complex ATPase subunit type 1 TsaE [Caldithrix sp.]
MEIIKRFKSYSIEDSKHIARFLADLLKPNDVVLMQGDLGSGKTFLVKEICRLWKTTQEAASPSFALIYQYDGPLPVNHFDFYRIEDVAELDHLGWEEYLEAGAVTFIEWPQIIENRLQKYYKLDIQFENDHRALTLKHNN